MVPMVRNSLAFRSLQIANATNGKRESPQKKSVKREKLTVTKHFQLFISCNSKLLCTANMKINFVFDLSVISSAKRVSRF